ncbi:MAG: quinoprotein relay system zinc metallohydrolase 2 [Pseudomonadota bacterium]
MFEAVIAICASLENGPCRDGLVPGYEAETAAQCQTHLSERPPDLGDMMVQGEARCVAMDAPLAVVSVAPGVFVHEGQIAVPDEINRGDVSNMGFVIGEDSVAVIDTGGARWIGEALWRAIRTETDKPISHIVLTHMHPDHVFGVGAFEGRGARVVGHENLPRALADRQLNYAESFARLIGPEVFAGSLVLAVDDLVEDRMTIDLGGRELTVRAWPAAHTAADLTVFDHESGTLFAGDLIFHRHAPALDGTLLGWQAVLKDMADMAVTQVIPGHGGPVLSWPDGAQDQMRYLDVLAADTRAAIAQGQRLGDAVEEIAESERGNWMLFDDYNPRNATGAFTELEWE